LIGVFSLLIGWQNRVKRFVFEADRKRALVGRLAMYLLCHEILGSRAWEVTQ
jgi:phosphopantetheinyl transferase